MKRAVCILIGLIALLSACGQHSVPTADAGTLWQEQYDLGVRCLSESNYEEAIIAFTAAIEIDPKRPEAYISLADVYSECKNYELALDILRNGIENVDDSNALSEHFLKIEDSLMQNLAEIGNYSFLFTENVVKWDDWLINDIPILESTISDFAVEFPDEFGYGYHVHSNGEETYRPFYITDDVNVGDSGNIEARFKDGEISWARLRGEAYDEYTSYFQPNLRDIKTDDSYAEVLRKIGISEGGIRFLSNRNDRLHVEVDDNTEFEYFMEGGYSGFRFGYYDFDLGVDCVLSFSFIENKLNEIYFQTHVHLDWH